MINTAAMLNQVKRLIPKRNLFYRLLHEKPQPKILYPLESRKLLKVAGSDASVFLQGLITNDMRHFDEGAKSMYAMFLNNKGRVLYDTLIHKSEDSFMLECDKNVLDQLLRHLKMFKLKRKVEIGDHSNHFKIWALIAPPETIIEEDQKNIHICKDPRLDVLGYRILSHISVKDEAVKSMFGKEVTAENSEMGYKKLRYQLGVSEGSSDLPPGSSFPLEVNCDYLHGVSFHKGCYIGQELTARVHHTGVVRKRIVPLEFSTEVTNLGDNTKISASDKPKSNIGKVNGYIDNFGIGLVRIKEAMEAPGLTVGNYTVKIQKPSWWPIEAPKEKASLNQTE